MSVISNEEWVVSYFNSTSNHNGVAFDKSGSSVVSYFNSTSNHNILLRDIFAVRLFLISILHQTTTDNIYKIIAYLLFLISILHQTTTLIIGSILQRSLFLISILHQTTTKDNRITLLPRCFLFQFYIKPQPRICDLLIVIRLCGRMNGTNGA